MRLIPNGFGAQSRQEPSFGDAPGAAQLPIGQMLMRENVLESRDLERILALQQKEGLRFGQAALRLKLVKPKDLQRALSAQFAHPFMEPGDSGLSRELAAAYKPASRQVELLRQQRSLLAQRWFATHPALAVLSPSRREGRSYFAANMAFLFAQLGRPTLLIDADMRRPRQHEIFGVSNRLGLSSVLAGRAQPAQAVQGVASIKTLYVLPVGAVPPNPLELLDRGVLPDVLKELSRQFSVILVDTPAGYRQGDAGVAAHGCGGALMLVRRHRTRLRDAQEFAARLVRAEVQLLGTVMNHY